VIVVGVIGMVILEVALTRDDVVAGRFMLTATEAATAGEKAVTWKATANEIGNMTLDGEPARVPDVMERIRQCKTVTSLTAVNAHGSVIWTATANAEGVVRFSDRDEPASLGELARAITAAAIPTDLIPTREATIADVLAENIPTPTLTRVSYPSFSYRDAFPDATDEPEVVIGGYRQAPMLADLDSMSPTWREHYPESLPPPAERLPRNPAVVRGPDGIGHYGGTWHRATSAVADVRRKIGYESFIRFDPSGKIQPCLAYKWEVTDNNRVYTFYLRKGQRWSDGHPFTTEDILWVTNALVGSGSQGSRMNWMQQTDGRMRLYPEDILEWPAFVNRILDEAAADAPSVGRQISKVGGKPLMDMLTEAQNASQANKKRQYRIIAKLNSLFREPAFLDAAAYTRVDLDTEIDELEAVGFSRLSEPQVERLNFVLQRRDLLKRAATDPSDLTPAEWIRLNLGLLRAAYRPVVDRARLKYV